MISQTAGFAVITEAFSASLRVDAAVPLTILAGGSKPKGCEDSSSVAGRNLAGTLFSTDLHNRLRHVERHLLQVSGSRHALLHTDARGIPRRFRQDSEPQPGNHPVANRLQTSDYDTFGPGGVASSWPCSTLQILACGPRCRAKPWAALHKDQLICRESRLPLQGKWFMANWRCGRELDSYHFSGRRLCGRKLKLQALAEQHQLGKQQKRKCAPCAGPPISRMVFRRRCGTRG